MLTTTSYEELCRLASETGGRVRLCLDRDTNRLSRLAVCSAGSNIASASLEHQGLDEAAGSLLRFLRAELAGS
jgi:hypothetical protein